MIHFIPGDCRERLKDLPDKSVQCVVTSPPYFGLRDYGTGEWSGGDTSCSHQKVTDRIAAVASSTLGGGKKTTGHLQEGFAVSCGRCGAVRTDSQIGLEASPAAYVAELVGVFREVWRVLRDDGTVWLNLGDSYNAYNGNRGASKGISAAINNAIPVMPRGAGLTVPGMKSKDLMMIPARVAIALCDDGWYLRKDIIWCLSGGTRVYARTQKGEMPMAIKDMVRLDPATVQLWNGEKWTQVLGWNETVRPDVTYEIELRNGQRIGCTGNHEWPTQRGNVRADQLHTVDSLFQADVIQTCQLPEPTNPRQPSALDDEIVGWFVGLYIAEGSQSEGTIQIASHTRETERFDRLKLLAEAFHGSAAVHKTSENGCTVSVNGPMLCGLIETYVSGRVASDKHLHPRCWQRSDRFLRAVLNGYLSGDGHLDAPNMRWRLGFCTNDELVSDLRTIGARLGVTVRLKRVIHKLGDAEFPGYKGELRFSRSKHHNNRDDGEVVAIRESRARKFWDIGVADEPHLFALASGVLTHNSKPNPMPESVTDRPTSSHEHVFLLTKRQRYFYDTEAVREECESGPSDLRKMAEGLDRIGGKHKTLVDPLSKASSATAIGRKRSVGSGNGRNMRDVWTIATIPYPDAHFAVMPATLAERCILAGTSERGACPACGAPWARTIDRIDQGYDGSRYGERVVEASGGAQTGGTAHSTLGSSNGKLVGKRVTTGWQPTCQCPAADPVPCVVLDPFSGAGTTALVADRLGRTAIGIDLNPTYGEMARERLVKDAGMFAEFGP